ncbi:serine/threonine-protein kinase Nek2-like [Primulina huaijiensis]|uniref:serine/threonine-protein kinase Nek2-like n=1 Tax=Primulina huaijiensis TaxID=1492673 RepID=UPI003CC70C3D
MKEEDMKIPKARLSSSRLMPSLRRRGLSSWSEMDVARLRSSVSTGDDLNQVLEAVKDGRSSASVASTMAESVEQWLNLFDGTSLPFPTRIVPPVSPYKQSVGLLDAVESPDVSVNAPRLDKMVDFPLASSEDPFLPIHRTSSLSAQCSSTSPYSADRSIMKDKCTVQMLDRALIRPHNAIPTLGVPHNGSECSENNPTSGGRSSGSSSYFRQRRFDTSSYQQRAEALEGLLEFSAQLLQQERIDELQVLLKPFGPEKVSPRETAIWLTKSFKEKNAA